VGQFHLNWDGSEELFASRPGCQTRRHDCIVDIFCNCSGNWLNIGFIDIDPSAIRSDRPFKTGAVILRQATGLWRNLRGFRGEARWGGGQYASICDRDDPEDYCW
jgi:hypothetical protein